MSRTAVRSNSCSPPLSTQPKRLSALMSNSYGYTALDTDRTDLTLAQESGVRDELLDKEPGMTYRKWGKARKVVEIAREAYLRNIGLLLVIGSQLLLSIVNVAVKKLNGINPPVTALQLIVVRMAITWVCSIVYMFSTGVPDPLRGPEGVRLLLVFRGVSGFFGLFGTYFSLQYLSLSDATVITFLAPLCTAAAGAVFLAETFSLKEAFAGFGSLIGVVLIARPPFIFGGRNEETDMDSSLGEVTPEQRLMAVGVALIGVLGATGAYTSLRAIGKRAHPLHSLVMFSFYSVVVASIGMIATKTPFILPTRLEWLAMLTMIGIFGFFAQARFRLTLVPYTPLTHTASGIYSQIVFATIFERMFFESVPSILSIVGTLIILFCALYVALTKKSTPSSAEEAELKVISLRDPEADSLERGLLERHSEDNEAEKRLQGDSSVNRD
ncbi:hypothetical protein NP233_g7579 [Leucocoprinus birnbaumii]|uniref:EamA domain-containing protein n=1 Tax=Leucocoprinus birnbaumii TaxID=56174 RepID=A0AAD5YPU2_9AGAR|nr:hypothetical protein NP233_g7579 [Leucocoprinus birnbaumii]